MRAPQPLQTSRWDPVLWVGVSGWVGGMVAWPPTSKPYLTPSSPAPLICRILQTANLQVVRRMLLEELAIHQKTLEMAEVFRDSVSVARLVAAAAAAAVATAAATAAAIVVPVNM